MEPKNFKFDDDAFDDVFSSSDDFEDVYSDDSRDENDITDTKQGDEFEDFFTGKDNTDDYDSFADEYMASSNDSQDEPVKKNINVNVEKKPYSYNYSKASQNKARRVTQDRVYDDVDEEIYSGKQPKDKKPKKKKSAGKVIAILLVIVLVIVGVIGVGGFGYAKSLTNKVDYKPLDANQYIGSAELMRKDGVKNILLIGVDAREGESNDATRSDTMMLISIDDNNKQIKMTSFLRDSYVDIPGYKWAKLNAAQSHGGTQLLVDTIEYNFKIDIDNYMLVNFDMFTTIIDSLGGVNVEVTEKEAKYINSKDHMTIAESAAFPEDIKAGASVHFTGAQALWYARIRYLDSDFMRTKRQQKVISAIISQAKQNPVDAVSMLKDIVPMVETDLTSNEMMSLGINAVKYIGYDLAKQQMPDPNQYKSETKNGQSCLVLDFEKNRSILKSFIFDKAEVETAETTTSK